MVELMVDILCGTRPAIRIGEIIPTDQVRQRLYSLDYGHLEYVFERLRRSTTEVRNLRASCRLFCPFQSAHSSP